MKTVVCTAHNGGVSQSGGWVGNTYQDLAALTMPTVRDYAEKWNYHFLYDPHRADDEGDACKIKLYKQVYESGHFGVDDVFMWIDTDAMVLNSDVRAENIVYHHLPRNKHFLIGCDINGPNTGVWFARFTPEAYLFLTTCHALYAAMGWADTEPYVQRTLHAPYHDIAVEVPGKIFNCMLYEEMGWDFTGEYGNYVNRYQDGDFILHLAGINTEKRIEIARRMTQKAIAA